MKHDKFMTISRHTQMLLLMQHDSENGRKTVSLYCSSKNVEQLDECFEKKFLLEKRRITGALDSRYLGNSFQDVHSFLNLPND